MIAGTTTYIFKENGIVTIRSTTGSQDSTYGFVKSGNDEIVFNIPAHSEDTNSAFYKMTFPRVTLVVCLKGQAVVFNILLMVIIYRLPKDGCGLISIHGSILT